MKHQNARPDIQFLMKIKGFKIIATLFLSAVSTYVCAQSVTTVSVGKQLYKRLENSTLVNVWGMDGKMKMPIDFSTSELGKFDTIEFDFYGMGLISSQNGERKELSIGAFVYPGSEEFPSKKITVRQKIDGTEGSRTLTFQYDIQFVDLPDTMSYQISFDEFSNEVSFHYGSMPLVNKVDSIYVGIFGQVLAPEELVFVHLLEGSPQYPESFYSFTNNYQYLNNSPSDSLKYTFGGLTTGIDKTQLQENFWVETTESGFKIPTRNLVKTATLYALDGRKVAEGKLLGEFVFFQNVKDLPNGVYPVKILLQDGRESAVKWSNN